MRAKSNVVTFPVARVLDWRKGNPKPPALPALGSCPVCEGRVTGLVGSPRRRPHIVGCQPCGCWVTVDEANDIENGAWK